MFPSRSPMGFVAILGVLALIGILIRNSVILIVQIEEHRREAWRLGQRSWIAMIGGIVLGTLLTLLFLPALYVAWFRVEAPAESKTKPAATIAAPPQACLV